MYAVIFKAEISEVNDAYFELVKELRELALNKYGCLEFTALTEGAKEIAISYWENQDQITLWKNDPKHILAQEQGKNKWYQSYRVQVVEIVREYSSTL